ncbi:MAG: hypothetical protein WBP85_15410 [Terracidiphilus sp.]
MKDPRIFLLFAALLGVLSLPALAQTSSTTAATIDIDTNVTTPLAPGFSGVSAELGTPVVYWDYRFNALANTLGFGWVRFPGGTSSDIYDWQAGEDNVNWYDEFPAGSGVASSGDTIDIVAGLGGARLIDAANRGNLLGAPLIICVNGFTDTPASAGLLAKFVKDNQIHVAAWELSNEPYLYTGTPTSFFPTPADYLDKMRHYRDAIKAELPDAIISIFVTDQAAAGSESNPWNLGIAAYPDKYWDAISFHDYPSFSKGPFCTWMADETAVLVTRTTSVIQNLEEQVGPRGVKILNTEFDPSIPNAADGTKSLTDDTVWGGVYSAEYVMRMSTQSAVLHVGPSQITNNAGVYAANDFHDTVEAAGKAGTIVNTLLLDYGFYVSAQGDGLAVLNSVMKTAVLSHQTVVSGGATVPATGIGPVPALYAMSYSNALGAMSVVITNKSCEPQSVAIRIDGREVAGPIREQFVTSAYPDAANEPSDQNAITIQTAISGNPITVPPYSVLRADLVTPPLVSFANAASLLPGAVTPQEQVTVNFPYPSQDASAIAILDRWSGTTVVPIQLISPTHATFTMPRGVYFGQANAAVLSHGFPVLWGSLDVGPGAPGVYSANANGAGVARAYWSDSGTPNRPAFTCGAGVALSCLSQPIPASVTVQLQGTGLREADQVEAFVAGQRVPVIGFGALAHSESTDQVTIFLPAWLAGTGEASVYLVADGKMSNMTTLKIQ